MSTTPTTTPEDAPELTETEALRRVIAGVNREVRRDASQLRDLVKDACDLRGQNIRKLATVAESKGKLKVGFESYLSYMSNAAGIAGMFDWDFDAFAEFLDGSPVKWGLRGLFDAFRALFGPAKPAPVEPKPAPVEPEGDAAGDGPADAEPTPLIDVVLSALPHLTADERQLVAMMLIELDTADDDATDGVAA